MNRYQYHAKRLSLGIVNVARGPVVHHFKTAHGAELSLSGLDLVDLRLMISTNRPARDLLWRNMSSVVRGRKDQVQKFKDRKNLSMAERQRRRMRADSDYANKERRAKLRQTLDDKIYKVAVRIGWNMHRNQFRLVSSERAKIVPRKMAKSYKKIGWGFYDAACAGVFIYDDRLIFFPTAKRRAISIPIPPLKLRLKFRDVNGPRGLLVISSDQPGVDELWGVSGPVTNKHIRLNEQYITVRWLAGSWRFAGWSIRGVEVSERVAMGNYTVEQALGFTNMEERRVALERKPLEDLVNRGVLIRRHKDKYGELFAEKNGTQHPDSLAFVQVVNSTPEPDGTWKKYVLRVPPHFSTARAAVAWTFGMSEDGYLPVLES